MLDETLLCLNQVTVLRQWSLPEFIDGARRHDIGTISVWRDRLAECDLGEAGRRLAASGLVVSSLCAAGLITTADAREAASAMDELKRAIDEAAAIRAGCLVFVAGGVDPRDKSVKDARARVVERLALVAPYAKAAGMRIALEPLHPMACGSRSVLSTLKIANDWCDALGADDVFGIALDTYAVWWDPELEAEIVRAGRRICAFHVSDWLPDTCDLRLDRGMMGDGLIDIPWIRSRVEAAGYRGCREVEIFSERNWWRRDPDEVIRTVKQRYQTAV
jgi:sugar phosphate isomerase/epimerase